MIRLNSKVLGQSTVQHLDSVQSHIDGGIDFAAKAARAQTAWDSKDKSAVKKAAFDAIKTELITMCVGVEICNYCENNEATDVEHIYPKGFFPERAFRWDNYLLACKTCNSGYKLDKFAVFSPVSSNNVVDLIRGNKPVTNDGLLIDPRTEDPTHFFWLDIQNKTFILDPRLSLGTRDKKRAEYTLELLGLNSRDALVAARETAAKYYLDRLDRYVKARESATRESATFAELEAVVQDPDRINQTLPFQQEKDRLCLQITADIRTYAHPTVWHELKRQRANLPKTNRLLTAAPEALAW